MDSITMINSCVAFVYVMGYITSIHIYLYICIIHSFYMFLFWDLSLRNTNLGIQGRSKPLYLQRVSDCQQLPPCPCSELAMKNTEEFNM